MILICGCGSIAVILTTGKQCMKTRQVCLLILMGIVVVIPGVSAGEPPARDLAREILAELVPFQTTFGSGETVPAARHAAARLVQAGFPEEDVRVLQPQPDLGVLVARYRGSDPNLRAALLMAHIDVVGVSEREWSVPPFQLTEKDGYLYGRGSYDNKSAIAMMLANFIRLKQAGFVPQRDLVILATADEETEQMTIQWMLNEHRELVDAAFALNGDGGFVVLKGGEPSAFLIQVAEKVYLNYRIIARGPGGHSSLPRPGNSIYRLTEAVNRIAAWRFPENVGEAADGYLRQFPDAAGTHANALKHTTCVVTQLKAGHAENALPEEAEANVNCRMLPQESIVDVEAKLRELIGDDLEMVPTWEPVPSPPSPMDAEIVSIVHKVAGEVFPGLPIVPEMATGATDGAFTRNAGIPTYGVQAIAVDPDDDRAHGTDERMPLKSFLQADHFWYRLLQAL
jgi:acetylornithine deacetylase/succinyl-diaminopimelate desuccinylase-like protein